MYLRFKVGGLSGIVMSNNLVDISLHDTYYIIVHFHIILAFNNILIILTFMFCLILNFLILSNISNNHILYLFN